MTRKATQGPVTWTGGIDVRFATRDRSPFGERMAQAATLVEMRIRKRREVCREPLRSNTVSVVAQALVILRSNLEALKTLPGTRQLWSDRVNGARVATLEHLIDLATVGPKEAEAVSGLLEYCLAFSSAHTSGGNLGTILVALQQTNARLVALCIESPNDHAAIHADAVAVATVARKLAAAAIRNGESVHA